ncbi:MAG: response regulator [Candidatus Sericytochromatia bacterium]
MSQRILVIDDEVAIQRSLQMALEAAGFEVLLACDGQQGLATITQEHPELVVLDLGLPELSGMEVLQRVRAWSRIPIIILSVQDQERQKVKALDLGANDYLTKPFGMPELLARIRASLRIRAERTDPPSGLFHLGPLSIDRASRQVWKHGQGVKLTKTEYSLLDMLISQAGQVLTHRQLLDAIWGPGCQNETHYLQVFVSRLRRKLEDDPTQPLMILTEPGVGYRLLGEGEA